MLCTQHLPKLFDVGHKFDQKKMGIIIKRLFDHPPLRPKVLSGQKHSCYIGLHMHSVEERSKSGPVINIPAWVNRVLPEHEIHGYQFTTLYLMDGVNQYIQVYISEEAGYYHIYLGDQKVPNISRLGLHDIPHHDECFFESMKTFAKKSKPCLSLSVDKIDVSNCDSSIVPEIHHWEYISNSKETMQFSSYHSHRCYVFMKLTSDMANTTCRLCYHDLKLVYLIL